MSTTVETLTDTKNKIAKLLETFSAALKKKGCGPEVLDLLHRISYYSGEFFISAGFFLEKFEISSFEKHESLKKEFVKELCGFQQRLEKGESMISFDLYDYVKNWYDSYLIHTEQEILEYLNKKE